MKTILACMRCQVETGFPNLASTQTAIIPDDGVIKHVCDKGHENVTVISNLKYELLADYAVHALIDNYHRECVASFASAMERLFEDFVVLTARISNIRDAEFESTWKPFINSSERQLGAFSICWLMQTGNSFCYIADKQTKFRNKVIHKGVIPSYDEAIEYGQAIIDCVQPVLELMSSEKYEQHRAELIMQRSKSRSAKYKGLGFHISSGAVTSPLGFDPTHPRFDLREHVSKRKDAPSMQQMADTARAYASQFEATIQRQQADNITLPSEPD